MRGTLHAIFWRLHTSYLKNDRPKAERALAMLEDEAGMYPEDLREEIGAVHYARYLKIADRIKAGDFGRLYGSGTSVPIIDEFKAEPSGPEREFHARLASAGGRPHFARALGATEGLSLIREFEMDPYGRCDFVGKEGRTKWVVEVKMGQAPPSVCSQVDRYRLAAELEMNYGLEDEVVAVVMAESYPPYVAAELSRLSVRMLRHRGTPESIEAVNLN